ncbi:MAG: phosphate ABC transporter permease subunit PstC [Spirochaetae bacterium HGW-Spirochaetae-5]|nr:MAG: phosphate ABC transporter permease subunit PstC [Spirochaetae bacterium HGW-Spirochaetae-5]
MTNENKKIETRKTNSLFFDVLIEKFFLIVGLTSLFILFTIMVFLIKEGIPLFKTVGVSDFIFGKEWYPTSDNPRFGIFPLILSSLYITIIASLIAIPLSLSVAIYISELAGSTVKEIVKPLIEIIASIPSVIIGFFGMVVVAPFLIEHFDVDSGLNLFNASLMLSFMVIPTIASISEDAISSVPMSLKEASYALGANRWETIIHIVIPASLSGIWTAIILGISRIIGETMIVLMVAGGATIIPSSLFDPVRPLTSNIAAEMAEAAVGGVHYRALFAIGIMLFILTFIFNLIADYLSNKYKFKMN